MNEALVFEQVSAGLPGKKFVASGLYRHAGFFRNGRFVKATGSALQSRAQLKAFEASSAQSGASRWFCPMCLEILPVEQDANGVLLPCIKCGYAEIGPRHVPADDKYVSVYASEPPDTMSRVIQYQAARAAGVPPPGPVSTPSIRLLVSSERTTQAQNGSTLERVVERQRQLGQRPADPYTPLRTMDAAPCERCYKLSCGCPPKAPDTLGQAAKRAAIRVQMEQDAAQIAYPQLRRETI